MDNDEERRVASGRQEDGTRAIPAARDTAARRSGRPPAGRLAQRRDYGGSLGASLRSAAIGFVLGAVFWHAVGFWSFVQGVVLNGDGSAEATAAGERATGRKIAGTVSGGPGASAPPQAANCTELVRDRATGETRAMPCHGDVALVRTNPSPRRADKAISVWQQTTIAQSWTTTTTPTADTPQR